MFISVLNRFIFMIRLNGNNMISITIMILIRPEIKIILYVSNAMLLSKECYNRW